MWIQPLGFASNTEGGEVFPLLIDGDAAQLQHGLGAGHRPAHPGTFQPILDHMPTGPSITPEAMGYPAAKY